MHIAAGILLPISLQGVLGQVPKIALIRTTYTSVCLRAPEPWEHEASYPLVFAVDTPFSWIATFATFTIMKKHTVLVTARLEPNRKPSRSLNRSTNVLIWGSECVSRYTNLDCDRGVHFHFNKP